LPANIGLSLDEGDTLLLGKVVKGTAISTGETLGIVKNTGTLDYASFIGAVLFLRPTFFAVASLKILPEFGGEFLHPFRHTLLVFFL
jgi:hypothetical protein